MQAQTKVLIGVLVATIVLIVIGVFFLSKSSPRLDSTSQIYQIDYSKGHKIGSDSAKVKLVEFSDFQCPACKAAQPVVKDIINSYQDKSFQFIYRHYPLSQHLNAKAAATTAEAAAEQDKFWQMHDKLFETQDKWATLANPTEFFVGLAKEIGLDETKIKDALDKNLFSSKIQQDINDGNAYSPAATPTFYLNGKKLEFSSFDELKTQIDQALK